MSFHWTKSCVLSTSTWKGHQHASTRDRTNGWKCASDCVVVSRPAPRALDSPFLALCSRSRWCWWAALWTGVQSPMLRLERIPLSELVALVIRTQKGCLALWRLVSELVKAMAERWRGTMEDYKLWIIDMLASPEPPPSSWSTESSSWASAVEGVDNRVHAVENNSNTATRPAGRDNDEHQHNDRVRAPSSDGDTPAPDDDDVEALRVECDGYKAECDRLRSQVRSLSVELVETRASIATIRALDDLRGMGVATARTATLNRELERVIRVERPVYADLDAARSRGADAVADTRAESDDDDDDVNVGMTAVIETARADQDGDYIETRAPEIDRIADSEPTDAEDVDITDDIVGPDDRDLDTESHPVDGGADTAEEMMRSSGSSSGVEDQAPQEPAGQSNSDDQVDESLTPWVVEDVDQGDSHSTDDSLDALEFGNREDGEAGWVLEEADARSAVDSGHDWTLEEVEESDSNNNRSSLETLDDEFGPASDSTWIESNNQLSNLEVTVMESEDIAIERRHAANEPVFDENHRIHAEGTNYRQLVEMNENRDDGLWYRSALRLLATEREERQRLYQSHATRATRAYGMDDTPDDAPPLDLETRSSMSPTNQVEVHDFAFSPIDEDHDILPSAVICRSPTHSTSSTVTLDE